MRYNDAEKQLIKSDVLEVNIKTINYWVRKVLAIVEGREGKKNTATGN